MIEVVATCVQLGLVITAIWYAWETRTIRLQHEKQFELLKKQVKLTNVPYLVPGILDVDAIRAKKQIQEDKELSQEEKKKRTEEMSRDTVKFTVGVHNPTTIVGRYLRIWIYDKRTQSFMKAGVGVEFISEKETEQFVVRDTYYDVDKVKEQMSSYYEVDMEFAKDEITLGDESYLVLVYMDIEGTPYMVKRGFEPGTNGDVAHKSSKVFFSN